MTYIRQPRKFWKAAGAGPQCPTYKGQLLTGQSSEDSDQ